MFGLPAHPLLVHVPIVLVPLATVLALLALWAPARRPALLAAAALSLLGAVGTYLAVGAGEHLEDRVGRTALVDDRERDDDAGDGCKHCSAVATHEHGSKPFSRWRSSDCTVQAPCAASCESKHRSRFESARPAPLCRAWT